MFREFQESLKIDRINRRLAKWNVAHYYSQKKDKNSTMQTGVKAKICI